MGHSGTEIVKLAGLGKGANLSQYRRYLKPHGIAVPYINGVARDKHGEGTLRRKVFDELTANTQISRSELQRKFPSIDIANELLIIEKRYKIKIPPGVNKRVLLPGSDLEHELVTQLTQTIKPLNAILRELGLDILSEHIVKKLRLKHRGSIFTREGVKLFGTMANERYGINPEKLRTEYLPLAARQQNEIIQRHMDIIGTATDFFPVPTLKQEFHSFALNHLRRGLERYAPEMCSERHFILLILKNAKAKFNVKRIHGEFIEQLEKLPLTHAFSQDEIDTLVRRHYNSIKIEISSMARRNKVREFVEDLTQEAAIRAVSALEVYDKNIHGTTLAFMRSIARGIVNDFARVVRSEKGQLRRYQTYQALWNAYSQNRPKYTTHFEK